MVRYLLIVPNSNTHSKYWSIVTLNFCHLKVSSILENSEGVWVVDVGEGRRWYEENVGEELEH